VSPDRVVYSFVLGWVVLLALLILLDWLGNPNRGSFRPKGERPPRDRESRRAERRRRRLEDDASVRAALRDAYGASSLRLTWSNEQETQARALDDSLVVEERPGAVEVASREVEASERTLILGDPLPNPDEVPRAEGTDGDGTADGVERPSDEALLEEPEPSSVPDSPPEPEPEPPRPRGWRLGGDPLALTAKGDEPTAATIRGRVWKNHGTSRGWSEANRELLAAGKAPRRTNPITGRQERGVVDTDTGRASWGSEPVDPFESA
jgi:hypothetical protein